MNGVTTGVASVSQFFCLPVLRILEFCTLSSSSVAWSSRVITHEWRAFSWALLAACNVVISTFMLELPVYVTVTGRIRVRVRVPLLIIHQVSSTLVCILGTTLGIPTWRSLISHMSWDYWRFLAVLGISTINIAFRTFTRLSSSGQLSGIGGYSCIGTGWNE